MILTIKHIFVTSRSTVRNVLTLWSLEYRAGDEVERDERGRVRTRLPYRISADEVTCQGGRQLNHVH